MESVNLTYLILMLMLLTTVLSNQLPTTERNDKIFRSIAFAGVNSRTWKMIDMEYDSETGDYFYLSSIYPKSLSSEYGYDYANVISRVDETGKFKWDRSYTYSIQCISHRNTLQYSHTKQTLYYTSHTYPASIVRVNSSNGDILSSHQVSPVSRQQDCYNQCRLTKDEQAYFCNFAKKGVERVIARFDTSTFRIDTVILKDATYQNDYNILAISNNEIFFSYISTSRLHHMVKASYIALNDSSYMLKEDFHQTLSENYYHSAASRLDFDNNQTIWHAVDIDRYVAYFQFNLTNFSLIGNKYVASMKAKGDGLDMEVSDGIVCILSDDYGRFLLVVNATTQQPIQVYNVDIPRLTFNLFLRNGHISIIGCMGWFGYICYHDEVPSFFNLEKYPRYSISSSYSFIKTNDYPLSNHTLSNHTMSSDLIPKSYKLADAGYGMKTINSSSFVLLMPQSSSQFIVAKSGSNVSLDLPLKIDHFGTDFTPCTVKKRPTTSWVHVDCDKLQVQVGNYTGAVNVSDTFSVKSTFYGGEINTLFNITIVPWGDHNCESCTNKTYDTCSVNYGINPITSLCETGPEYCSTGYQWSNQTSSCVLIPKACPEGYQLNNISLECEIIPTLCPKGSEWSYETSSCIVISQICYSEYAFNNKTKFCQTVNGNCAVGYIQKNDTSPCIKIPENCFYGFEWNNDTLSCILYNNLNYSMYGPTYNCTMTAEMSQMLGGIGISLGFLIAFACGISAQNAWAIIHFLQLVLILPLVALSMHRSVRNFIISNAYAAFSVYVLPISIILEIPMIKDLFFYQPDEYLWSLGWLSGSTLVNNFMLFMIILVLALIHLILYLMKDLASQHCLVIKEVYKFFTFTVYIRIALLVFMPTTLMLASEIKYYTKVGNKFSFRNQKTNEYNAVMGNDISIIFCSLFLIFSLSFLLMTYISWKRNKGKMKIDDKCKTREFYNGILEVPRGYLPQQQEERENQAEEISEVSPKIKVARLYSLVFLLRRLILAFFVVFIPSSSLFFTLKISILLILQIAYVVYAIFVRSFERKIHQVVEVINELIFLILLMFLVEFPSKSRWTYTAVSMFISIILLQLFILFSVSFISAILKICMSAFRCVNRYGSVYNRGDQSRDVSIEVANQIEISQLVFVQFGANKHLFAQSSNLYDFRVNASQESLDIDTNQDNESQNSVMKKKI